VSLFNIGDRVEVKSGRYKGYKASVLIPRLRMGDDDIIVRILLTEAGDMYSFDREVGVYQYRLRLLEPGIIDPNFEFKQRKKKGGSK